MQRFAKKKLARREPAVVLMCDQANLAYRIKIPYNASVWGEGGESSSSINALQQLSNCCATAARSPSAA
jgi:hypothetical protein